MAFPKVVTALLVGDHAARWCEQVLLMVNMVDGWPRSACLWNFVWSLLIPSDNRQSSIDIDNDVHSLLSLVMMSTHCGTSWWCPLTVVPRDDVHSLWSLVMMSTLCCPLWLCPLTVVPRDDVHSLWYLVMMSTHCGASWWCPLTVVPYDDVHSLWPLLMM